MPSENREELSLSQAVINLLNECRMILPGVQTLFGFQLIATFSEGFDRKLGATGQHLHFLALGLVVVAMALVMAPAAYHRQTGPLKVSRRFVKLGSRLLLSAMVPLMLAVTLDFCLIAQMIFAKRWFTVLLALVLLSLFSGVWFLLPRRHGSD